MCVCTRKECPFVASDAIPSNSSDKGSQKKLNKSAPVTIIPQKTASHQENRLALGSGTDVKSQATFSSGPDPSVRQQAQLGAQNFLTPLHPKRRNGSRAD